MRTGVERGLVNRAKTQLQQRLKYKRCNAILFGRVFFLQDNTDWSTVKLKQGLLIMMMGTKEENALPPPPKEAVKFVEDMDMDQAPSVVQNFFSFVLVWSFCSIQQFLMSQCSFYSSLVQTWLSQFGKYLLPKCNFAMSSYST